MRLDEWQSFIESQFLEDKVPLSSPPSPAAPLEETVWTDAQTPLESLTETISHANEASDTCEIHVPSEVHSPSSPDVYGIDETNDTDSILEIRPDLSTITFELDVPAFDRYLPISRGGTRPRSSRSAPVEPAKSETILEADAIPFLKDSPAAAPAQIKRTPKTRARHARSIRPENVQTGLSAADLWAKVPRHVQTLLALERIEEEQETAQFSYKRVFTENRRALIDRLLDPILTLEETARLLNVCPTTVRRYTNRGILTYYRKEPDRPSGGTSEKETRQRRFRLSDILAFLNVQHDAVEADSRADAPVLETRFTNQDNPDI